MLGGRDPSAGLLWDRGGLQVWVRMGPYGWVPLGALPYEGLPLCGNPIGDASGEVKGPGSEP